MCVAYFRTISKQYFHFGFEWLKTHEPFAINWCKDQAKVAEKITHRKKTERHFNDTTFVVREIDINGKCN